MINDDDGITTRLGGAGESSAGGWEAVVRCDDEWRLVGGSGGPSDVVVNDKGGRRTRDAAGSGDPDRVMQKRHAGGHERQRATVVEVAV